MSKMILVQRTLPMLAQRKMPTLAQRGSAIWAVTGHLIVPALSRRRAGRGVPLGMLICITHVVNVTSLINVIAISCICIRIILCNGIMFLKSL